MQREQDETRVQELKEELSRITQQLQDEQNKLLHQQQTQEKEKEEYARSDTYSDVLTCTHSLQNSKLSIYTCYNLVYFFFCSLSKIRYLARIRGIMTLT